MISELKAPIRIELVHDMLSFCSAFPRYIEEICTEHHIHRKTFYTYQQILNHTSLLTELNEPPEGKGGTRARWFSTSSRGEDFVRRLRLATTLLGPYGIIKGAELLDENEQLEETPLAELTCSQCGMPVAHLKYNSTCSACGFDYALPPVDGMNFLIVKTLETHASILDEIQNQLPSLTMEIVEEKKHTAELQHQVERLYEKLEEITVGMDDVRSLIKKLQPLVKQSR